MMSFETVRNEEKTMLRRLTSLSLALVVAVGAISACDGGSQERAPAGGLHLRASGFHPSEPGRISDRALQWFDRLHRRRP